MLRAADTEAITVTPERKLLCKIIERAFLDARCQTESTRALARRWIFDNDREEEFSFINLCEILSLDVESLRGAL